MKSTLIIFTLGLLLTSCASHFDQTRSKLHQDEAFTQNFHGVDRLR